MTNPLSKLITGPLHLDNKWASDWGYQGFIGYGCHRYVVVVDPKTLQVVQTLGPHNSTVTHVKWAREKYHHAFATGRTYSLIVAAADSGGNILIWDVVSGTIRTEFQRPSVHIRFLELEWIPGHDESHDLLMVLRFPGQLEMWDAYAGVQLWKTDFGENLLSFALDPLNINRLICMAEVTHLVLVSDLNPTKQPQGDKFKYIWYSDPYPVVNNQTSNKRYTSGDKSPRRTTSSSSWSRMANIATNMILNTGSSSDSLSKRWSISDEDILSSCLQVVFSPVHNHVVILVFSTNILFIDVDVELVVGAVRIDRSSPFIMKVIPCATSDILFCLHDNGSSSVRIRKQNLKQKHLNEALDMTYEQISLSDSLRLLRNVKIVGFSNHPITEARVAIFLSDSRVIFLDAMATSFHKNDSTTGRNTFTLGEMLTGLKVVLPGKRSQTNPEEVILRLVVSGLLSGLNNPVICISMRQSRATFHEVGQHLAVGSGCGSIQLVNVYSGQVEQEYKLFSYPVRGMEWINASKLLAFTYTDPSNYGNRGVRNEIIVLNTNTGKVDVIRGNSTTNEGPVQFVKASPSGKYMVVAVKEKPIEIWNIRAKQLLKKLTDIQFKPNNMAWYPTVSMVSATKSNESKNSIVEQLFISVSHDTSCLIKIQINDGIISDTKHFSIEGVFGHTTSKADIQTLVWKNMYLITGDRTGQIYFKHNQDYARKIHENLGMAAKCIRFAPGRHNNMFLVLWAQSLDVWEVMDNKVEFITSSPSLNSAFIDATWTGPESIAIVTDEFCLHVMKITAKSSTPPFKKTEDDFVHVHEKTMKISALPMKNWKIVGVFSPSLFDRKAAFLLKYSLQCNIEPFKEDVQPLFRLVSSEMTNAIKKAKSTAERCLLIARLFGDEYDMEFWKMFKYVSKVGQMDTSCLKDLEKPLDFTEWISKLLTPSSEVNDLLDLSTNDLDTRLESNTPTTNTLDGSWIDALVKEQEPFMASSIGLLMDHDAYRSYEASRLHLHNKKADSYRAKKVCASRFIMMDKITMATQVLMETDTDNMEFRHDCLKACLTSCVQASSESVGTLKLAATHLIAAGHLQENIAAARKKIKEVDKVASQEPEFSLVEDGVDLLCLMNKQADACKYMLTYGHWLEAVWLAKISLSETERLSLICKFADHLWQGCQKMKAILVMLSVGQFTSVLRMLFSLGQYDTAALFLQACTEHGLLSNTHATDQVYCEFAKCLIVTQYQSAVEHYCKQAGDMGHSLLQDIQATDKTHSTSLL